MADMPRIGQRWKIRGILLALLLTFALSEKHIEKLGDSYQIALPIIALGCSVTNRQAFDFALRYVAQWGVVQSSKQILGTTPINQRPNGNYRGMPSGHTATAVFGASNIVHQCIHKNPAARAVVLLTAGFVGASRIDAEAHNIWQVLAGALVGWLGDRAFRRISPLSWARRLVAKARPKT